jgi:VanZ family protein
MFGSKIHGLVCMLVLCGTLTLGLWPFHAPRNDVSWLSNENGLRFSGYGTLLSTEKFQMTDSEDQASSSLEFWIQPGLTNDHSTLLAFSTAKNPLQLSVHQYRSGLILAREIQGVEHRTAVIGIDGVFDQTKPIFITITSGPAESAMYFDGRLARSFPGFRLGKDLSGQLVIGSSPVDVDGWLGKLKGLAIYHKELTAQEVARHFETWTKQGAPELRPNESLAALYLFNEHGGNVVHTAGHPDLSLYIPSRFSLPYQPFLKPFWREYEFSWAYLETSLLNVIGFVPLGFFFYAYWSSAKPIKAAALVTVALGFAVSLSIEILQSYLPTRSSGTTDLMTNTVGTFLGVKLYGSKALQTLLTRVFETH